MESKVMRPCYHQTEDSGDLTSFNYCPWCGIHLATEDEKPEEDENDLDS